MEKQNVFNVYSDVIIVHRLTSLSVWSAVEDTTIIVMENVYFVQIPVLNVHHKLSVQLVLKDMCYLRGYVKKPVLSHVTVVIMEYV